MKEIQIDTKEIHRHTKGALNKYSDPLDKS